MKKRKAEERVDKTAAARKNEPLSKGAKARKIIASVFISIAITVVIYLGIALTLVFTDAPAERPVASGGGVGFAEAIEADYGTLPDTITYAARDGSLLPYRRYDGGSNRLIVLVHGSGWHGMQFHPMASKLAASALGTVVVPDLRGHGADPERRGDIDYIGQLEDDLADLIKAIRAEQDYGKVVLGGHSSGGGLVVRFAGGEHHDSADAFILMAPFLKYNAPTTKANSGGWAHTAARRIAGLTMLNNVGMTRLNHLPVIGFAMPDDVLDGPYGDTATTSYSYRLNTAFAPRMDYESDLATMKQPFLLIAGSEDEAFSVENYQPVISAQTDSGDYQILEGISHIGITTDSRAIDVIAKWMDAH